jgi:hypothetical protein
MHSLLPLLQSPASLAFLDLAGNESMIGVIAVSMSMGIPIVAIVVSSANKRHREQLWHDTARLALEKGQPIPTRPLTDEEVKSSPLPSTAGDPAAWERIRRANRRRKDIRNGLILTAIGAALYLTRRDDHFGRGLSFLVYIPMFMGLALLLNGLLDGLFSHSSGDSGDLPPRS